MTQNVAPKLSDDAVAQALDTCASEPVHIPGIVQPFGCLVCINSKTGLIDYASENCQTILKIAAKDLLNQSFRDVFGRDIGHALSNASSMKGFRERIIPLGTFTFNTLPLDISCFASGDVFVVQFEKEGHPDLGGNDSLTTMSFLTREIQNSDDQSTFLNVAIDLLRHLTGYDRVVVYRFDPAYNGEVIAEARRKTLEPMLGLHYPHWDIPKQARDIMAKVPLRFIEDVDQVPAPLLAASDTLPPLDISLAECRGVSPVHLEYLRNMGTRGTLTLSIVLDGTLWGMISFHHGRPIAPPAKTRILLTMFLEVFKTKLLVLRKQAQLDLTEQIDAIKDSTLGSIERAESEEELTVAGPAILQAMECDGLAVLKGSVVKAYGMIPDYIVLHELAEKVQTSDLAPLIVGSLKEDFPALAPHSNEIAGALAVASGEGRTLFLFRREIATTISWAGNPDKTIESHDGHARLRPRGSFSLFLETVSGRCIPWTEDDIIIAERIWALINSAERQELRNRLLKQQELMIGELNHRVRNILSLVRSVSRQARRHNSSLKSYSEAIEQRIQALAAAHDLASGVMRNSVPIRKLIDVELKPYKSSNKITISDNNAQLRPEMAPIFSLVIHELATNAAKYGALSVEDGTVDIALEDTAKGLNITWRERNGPAVTLPNSRGFGATLIEQAVPYEMGGTADLRFEKSGVEADLFLTHAVLVGDPAPSTALPETSDRLRPYGSVAARETPMISGTLLLVEDNYTIAKDMHDQLVDAGIGTVKLCSNSLNAMKILDTETPEFAILDVNLGAGQTSEPIALRLLANNVPFCFVTGFSDLVDIDPRLRDVRRLTKPVITGDLLTTITEILGQAKD